MSFIQTSLLLTFSLTLLSACSPLSPSVSKFSSKFGASSIGTHTQIISDSGAIYIQDSGTVLVTPSVLSVHDYNSTFGSLSSSEATESLTGSEVGRFSTDEDVKTIANHTAVKGRESIVLSSTNPKVYIGASDLNQVELSTIQNSVKVSLSVVQESGTTKLRVQLAKPKSTGDAEKDATIESARLELLNHINNLGIHFDGSIDETVLSQSTNQ